MLDVILHAIAIGGVALLGQWLAHDPAMPRPAVFAVQFGGPIAVFAHLAATCGPGRVPLAVLTFLVSAFLVLPAAEIYLAVRVYPVGHANPMMSLTAAFLPGYWPATLALAPWLALKAWAGTAIGAGVAASR
jgi:hypothetical protein